MPKFKVGDIVEVIDEGYSFSSRSWIVESIEGSRYGIRYQGAGVPSQNIHRSLITELDRICRKVGSINKDSVTLSSTTYLDSDDITSEDKDIISKALEYYPNE
jgi:hypothetical protein